MKFLYVTWFPRFFFQCRRSSPRMSCLGLDGVKRTIFANFFFLENIVSKKMIFMPLFVTDVTRDPVTRIHASLGASARAWLPTLFAKLRGAMKVFRKSRSSRRDTLVNSSVVRFDVHSFGPASLWSTRGNEGDLSSLMRFAMENRPIGLKIDVFTPIYVKTSPLSPACDFRRLTPRFDGVESRTGSVGARRAESKLETR